MQIAQAMSSPASALKLSVPIDFERIIVVPKLSKLQYQAQLTGMTKEQLITKYRNEGVNTAGIIKGHYQQKHSLEALRRVFEPSQFVGRNSLKPTSLAQASLVIALGGDDHFTFVSHFVGEVPILGVNSDPLRSEGALTTLSISAFEDGLHALVSGCYTVEKWTRASALIDNKVVGIATSQLYIGNRDSEFMSRHNITLGIRHEEQEGSGLLVTTGAGSTGWYKSASRYLYQEGSAFPRTSTELRYLLREPYEGRLSVAQMPGGVIRPDEELKLEVLSDNEPILSIDSVERIKLRRGSNLTIRIAEEPLGVIVFN